MARKGGKKKASRGGLRRAPVASSRRRTTGGASASSEIGGATIVVKHSEYLWDHLSSIAYAWDSLPINPGMPGTFPWLSALANRYEKYRFRKLQIKYKPACSTATPGRVIMTIDHDPADVGPDTKQQALANFGALCGAPWEELTLDVLKGLKKEEWRYTRGLTLGANLDVKTYDCGNAFLASEGQAGDGAVLGDIILDYEVELAIPQLDLTTESGWQYLVVGGCSNLLPFGTANGTKTGYCDVYVAPDGSLMSDNGFEGMISAQYSSATLGLLSVGGSTTAKAAAVIGTIAGTGGTVVDLFKAIIGPGQKLFMQLASYVSAASGALRFVSANYDTI